MNLLELSISIIADDKASSAIEEIKGEAQDLDATDAEVEAECDDQASSDLEDVDTALEDLDGEEADVSAECYDDATSELEGVEDAMQEVESESPVEVDVECDASDADSSLEDFANGGMTSAITQGNILSDALEAVVGGLGDIVQNSLSYGDTIDKQSQKIGISAQAYQEWSNILGHCGADISVLRTGMKTLSTAAENNSEDFGELGISMEDVHSLSKEDLFSEVVAGLQEMENGTKKTKIASDLLGKGATELGALFNMTAEDTQNLKDNINEMGGVMDEDAIQASVDYQDTMLDLQTQLQATGGELMEKLLPPLCDLIDNISDFVSSDEFQGFLDWLSQLAPVFEAVGTAIGIVTVAYGALKTAETVMTVAQTLLNTAMSANPIGAIITIIMVLVGVFVTLWTQCDGFREFWQNLWNGICNIVGKVVGAIGDFFKSIPKVAQKVWDKITNAISDFIKGVGDFFAQIPETIKKWFNKAIDWIKKLPERFIEMAGNIVQGIIDGITNMGQNLLDAFVGIVQDAWNGILGFFGIASPSKLAREVGQYVMQGLVVGVEDESDNVIDVFYDTAKSAVDAAEDALGTFTYEPFENGLDGISGALSEDLQAAMDDASAELTTSVKVDETNSAEMQALQQQNAMLSEIIEKLGNMGVYINGKTLVGEISSDMNQALGWSAAWSATS